MTTEQQKDYKILVMYLRANPLEVTSVLRHIEVSGPFKTREACEKYGKYIEKLTPARPGYVNESGKWECIDEKQELKNG